MYRMRAIISRSLYIFTLFFTAVYNAERLIFHDSFLSTFDITATIQVATKKKRIDSLLFIYYTDHDKLGKKVRFIGQSGFYYLKLFWASKSAVSNQERFIMAHVRYVGRDYHDIQTSSYSKGHYHSSSKQRRGRGSV